MVEERAGTDSAREPLGLSQADDERTEDVLKHIIFEIDTDISERFGGLLTHDRLVRLSQALQEWQKDRLVW